jgi:hypothetical protein
MQPNHLDLLGSAREGIHEPRIQMTRDNGPALLENSPRSQNLSGVRQRRSEGMYLVVCGTGDRPSGRRYPLNPVSNVHIPPIRTSPGTHFLAYLAELALYDVLIQILCRFLDRDLLPALVVLAVVSRHKRRYRYHRASRSAATASATKY